MTSVIHCYYRAVHRGPSELLPDAGGAAHSGACSGGPLTFHRASQSGLGFHVYMHVEFTALRITLAKGRFVESCPVPGPALGASGR